MRKTTKYALKFLIKIVFLVLLKAIKSFILQKCVLKRKIIMKYALVNNKFKILCIIPKVKFKNYKCINCI